MVARIDERMQLVLSEKRIGESSAEEIINQLARDMLKVYLIVGYQPPEKRDFMAMLTLFANELTCSFRHLTTGEVTFCLERGAKGDLGDFTGLNLRTFLRWLKHYQTSDFRYQAMQKQREAAERQQVVLITAEDEKQSSNDFLQRTYQRFLNGEPMERLMPARAYRMLQERNLICHTAEEKWAAMALFAGWKPQTRLPLDAEILQQWRKSEAMGHLLSEYFGTLRSNGAQRIPF